MLRGFLLIEIGYIQSKFSHCVNPYLCFFFKQENIKSESSLHKRRNKKKKRRDIYNTVYAFQRAIREVYFGYELTKFQVRLNSRTESKTKVLQVTWLSIV